MTSKLLFSLFVLANWCFAQNSPLWLRYAALSPDGSQVAFTYQGDLYLVPSTGGQAAPITFHQAHDFMPVWSHDGRYLAFASDRHGNFDIFNLRLEDGNITRLTFHSAQEYPYAYTSQDQAVIFGGARMDVAEHRQYPTGSQPELYQVPVHGGRVKQVLTVPAEDVQTSSDGRYLVYHDKKGGENAWRKHHTSSIARDLWIYDSQLGHHRQLTSYKGEDRNPVFTDNDKSLYYLSEESGSMNVYKLSISQPQQKQKITDFKLHPVRSLSADRKGNLCFSYDGELYLKPVNGEPSKIAISIRTELKNNPTQIIPVSGQVREMAVAPNGKEVAYIVRGEVFVSALEGGLTKRITNTPGQERFLSFSPDGRYLLYAAERNKRWAVYRTSIKQSSEPYFYGSTLLDEEPLLAHSNHEYYQPVYSPDGKEIAFIEDRVNLKIINLATKQTRTLLDGNDLFYMADGDQYFTWSPDNQWLSVEYSPMLSNSEIILLKADGSGEKINLTQSGYQDNRPKWVNGGKQLLWFSDRDGLRSYANSGQRQSDVYTLFFDQEAWDRFNLNKEDYTLLKDIEEQTKKDSTQAKKPAKTDSLLVLEWAKARDRKTKLTIHSSALADALLSKDGEKLFYLARFERGYNLWSTQIRTRETKMELALNAGFGSMVWDKEQKEIFLLADGRISKINPENGKQQAVTIRGELELNTLAERTEMFEHVWRRAHQMFYTSTMHGADWEKLKIAYAKHLPSISNGHEFAELLSELLGELNVSHAGARFNPTRSDDADQTASLGIFFDYNHSGDGIRITEIIPNGPLDKNAWNLRPGMVIEQIDGQVIIPGQDQAYFLNRKTGQFTLLTILDPLSQTRQNITVKPITLGEENQLLYRRWVRQNQEEVTRLSNGTLGYVHIPGMGDGPYRTAYEDMMGKYFPCKAMIVDTRFNSGGDLVSDLAMFFTGTPYLFYHTDKRQVGIEPPFRWTKPTLALVNEANYSDGHCFACGYQDLKIGKMVGMPVPGTCSFAGWEMLQDGSTIWGAVPVSTKNARGQWLENLETVPDIVLKNDPAIISKGKDQQLEKAVETLLQDVKR